MNNEFEFEWYTPEKAKKFFDNGGHFKGLEAFEKELNNRKLHQCWELSLKDIKEALRGKTKYPANRFNILDTVSDMRNDGTIFLVTGVYIKDGEYIYECSCGENKYNIKEPYLEKVGWGARRVDIEDCRKYLDFDISKYDDECIHLDFYVEGLKKDNDWRKNYE